MAPNYYYMWEFVTSLAIIILVAAYIIHDRVKIRYESQALDEAEKIQKTDQLDGATQLVLGTLAVLGGIGWIIYLKTVKIYISPQLEGFHNFIPPIVMGIIGVILLVAGGKKYFVKHNS